MLQQRQLHAADRADIRRSPAVKCFHRDSCLPQRFRQGPGIAQTDHTDDPAKGLESNRKLYERPLRTTDIQLGDGHGESVGDRIRGMLHNKSGQKNTS